MDVLTNNIFEWGVFLLLLGGAIYTLRIIGEEKSSFREDSYSVHFGDLVLMIPNWWTITHQSETELKFERTDTRYDWFAKYQYIKDAENKSVPMLLEEKLNREEIEFDMDVVFETDSRVLFRDDKIQEYFQEVTRVEGQGSKNVEDRIYYDIYIMKPLNDDGYFIFESMSSVLNGLVEGPYFEESMSELSFNEKA